MNLSYARVHFHMWKIEQTKRFYMWLLTRVVPKRLLLLAFVIVCGDSNDAPSTVMKNTYSRFARRYQIEL